MKNMNYNEEMNIEEVIKDVDENGFLTEKYIMHFCTTEDMCLRALTYASMNALITREEMNEILYGVMHCGQDKFRLGYYAMKLNQQMFGAKCPVTWEYETVKDLKVDILDALLKCYKESNPETLSQEDKEELEILAEHEQLGTYLISIANYEKYIKPLYNK